MRRAVNASVLTLLFVSSLSILTCFNEINRKYASVKAVMQAQEKFKEDPESKKYKGQAE